MKNLINVTISIFVVIVFMFGLSSKNAVAVGPATVNLITSSNYVILSKAGITTTGVTKITGNVGVSPIAATSMTGFGLIIDKAGQFSTSSKVIGKIYVADYKIPTPSILTTAILDMQTAYADAASRKNPNVIELGTGNIGGKIIAPGLYKWSTPVNVTKNVTISGGKNDIWIFQIAGTLDISSGKQVILKGGAQAKNIFWQVAGATTLGTYSTFNGNILGKTNIAIQTGARLNGKALAQTAVTLDGGRVQL